MEMKEYKRLFSEMEKFAQEWYKIYQDTRNMLDSAYNILSMMNQDHTISSSSSSSSSSLGVLCFFPKVQTRIAEKQVEQLGIIMRVITVNQSTMEKIVNTLEGLNDSVFDEYETHSELTTPIQACERQQGRQQGRQQEYVASGAHASSPYVSPPSSSRKNKKKNKKQQQKQKQFSATKHLKSINHNVPSASAVDCMQWSEYIFHQFAAEYERIDVFFQQFKTALGIPPVWTPKYEEDKEKTQIRTMREICDEEDAADDDHESNNDNTDFNNNDCDDDDDDDNDDDEHLAGKGIQTLPYPKFSAYSASVLNVYRINELFARVRGKTPAFLLQSAPVLSDIP